MIVPNEINEDLSKTYNKDFFDKHKQYMPCYIEFAKYLKTKVTSITDYGCGHGQLVDCLLQEDIDAYGLEGSTEAAFMWKEEYLNKYKITDFTKENQEIPETEYVISTEVAEHLHSEYAEQFVKYLVTHNPKGVFFGAATVFQDFNTNPSHVNEQPFVYWINIFNKFGYDVDIKETYELKRFFGSKGELFTPCWWYSKNMFVFKKISEIKGSDFNNIKDILYIQDVRSHRNIFNIMMARDKYEYMSIILDKYIKYINVN